MNASGPTIAPIVTGSSGSSTWRGSNGGRNASTCVLRRDVDRLVRVREHEAVHADHHRQRQLLGELERLDVQVDRLLVRLGVELDPAGVALRHRVAVVVPDVDRRPDRAVRDRHHDRQPEPGGVVERLRHVEQALARRGRVRARAGGRGADRGRHRRELGLDDQVLARRELARADEVGERLDDMRLRRDRVGADHLRAAERDRLGDGLRSFDLATQRSPPLSATRRTPRSPRRRCARRSRPRTSRGSRPRRTRARRRRSGRRTRRAAPRSGAAGRGARVRAPWREPSAIRAAANRSTNSSSPSSSKLCARVDEQVALRTEAAEDVDLVQQRRDPGRSARRAR